MVDDHEIKQLDPMTRDVTGCSRCGQDHKALLFRKLEREVHHGDGEVDYGWAPCPTNGEPILLAHRPRRT